MPGFPSPSRAAVGLLILALAGCGGKELSPAGHYRAFCERCHGPEGKGDPRSVHLYPGLDLTRSRMVREGDRELVRRRIAEGYGPMPGFAHRLSEKEIEALVDWTFRLAAPGEAPRRE
jgi:mono/diheme cytochrome c family protein